MKVMFFLPLTVVLALPAQGMVWHVSPIEINSVHPDQQFRTIAEAAKIVSPGDTVLIHRGTYREAVIIETDGTAERPIRFEAAPAEEVVLTGVDPLVDWKKESGDANVYSAPWAYRFIGWSETEAFPPDEYHRLIGRAEQVLLNGELMRQTLDRNQLKPGMFFVDGAGKRLYVALPPGVEPIGPNGATRIEAATRSILWECKGRYVVTHGLQFRYAANPALEGGGKFTGRGDAVEDCLFDSTNAAGAHLLAEDLKIRRCTFQNNGEFGFHANHAHRLLVSDCIIRNNNTKGFSRQWGAGGNKIVLSRDVVLERCRFLDNNGPGIWFDIGNENCTVRNCLIAGNNDAGIFYEISYGLHAHDNVITGNGFLNDPTFWGAQAGVVVSSSANCLVSRNLLLGNREGFNFREQPRTTSRIDHPLETQFPVWNHDEVIRNNIIASNHDAQTRGWFGVGDRRLWPKRVQKQEDRKDEEDLRNGTIEYVPVEKISLEDLHLDMSHNIYATQDDQPLFIWGASWLPHVTYSSIAAVQHALKLEEGSRVTRLPFRDIAKRDYRLPLKKHSLLKQSYPRGEVPGARLGSLD